MNPLRRRLLDKGMTPEELAERLSGQKPRVSSRTIRRWATDGITGGPSPALVKVVADYFSVPPSEFVEELERWAAENQDGVAA